MRERFESVAVDVVVVVVDDDVVVVVGLGRVTISINDSAMPRQARLDPASSQKRVASQKVAP